MLAVLRDAVERAGNLDGVVSRAAVDHVVTVPTDDHVTAGAAGDVVAAGAGEDEIVARTAVDHVVSGLARDLVVPEEPVEAIVAAVAVDQVEVRRTVDRVRCARPVEAAEVRVAMCLAARGVDDVNAPAPALLSRRDRDQDSCRRPTRRRIWMDVVDDLPCNARERLNVERELELRRAAVDMLTVADVRQRVRERRELWK